MEPTRNPNLEIRPRYSEPPPGDELVGERPAWFWTAVPPRGAPGATARGTLRALRPPPLAPTNRRAVLDYFTNGWVLTELLFSSLQGRRAFYQPPYHRLRHPLVFYLGHPAALYVNKLRVAGLLEEAVRPDFETLFETGVDEMGWDDLSRGEIDWPSVRDVCEYRRTVYGRVRDLILRHPDLEGGAVSMDSPLWALFMALEHERIHLETSSVSIRELPVELVRRPAAWPEDGARREPARDVPSCGVTHPENPLRGAGGRAVILGKPQLWPSFGWDNEYGERHVEVPAFRASQYLISNGELFEFVAAGGYTDRRWWSDEGWAWRQYRNARWPTFWVADGPAGLHRYRLRTIFAIVDMPWDWPAEVNHHEAKAYCAWRSARDHAPFRLLTEAEHHCLRAPRRDTTSGHDEESEVTSALALSVGSPRSVDGGRPGPTGHHDVFGNVWSWLEDHFHPLPGFRIHRLYEDFSTPCFDAKHQMISGGSFASIGDEASVFARFHFRPHFFQHCGFRVAVTENPDAPNTAVRLDATGTGAAIYESTDLLAQYLLLHHATAEAYERAGTNGAPLTRFPQRSAALVIEFVETLGIDARAAVDVGCAVGGASFELARRFERVVGVDLSASFVRAAERLRRGDAITYEVPFEGELRETFVARIDPPVSPDRIEFRQADACSLPADLAEFDAVLVANLLCRVPSPRAVLRQLRGSRALVRRGGIVVITSPYSWSETYTPQEAWLGGYERDGRRVTSFEGLREMLEPDLELVAERELPLLIREHARKYQHVVSHATVWRRMR